MEVLANNRPLHSDTSRAYVPVPGRGPRIGAGKGSSASALSVVNR